MYRCVYICSCGLSDKCPPPSRSMIVSSPAGHRTCAFTDRVACRHALCRLQCTVVGCIKSDATALCIKPPCRGVRILHTLMQNQHM